MNLLLLQEKLGTSVKHLLIGLDDLPGLPVTLLHNAVNLAVNGLRHFLTVSPGMGQVPSDKHFIVIIPIGHQANPVRHTILSHHGMGRACGPFDVIGGAGGDISKDNLLRYPSPQQDCDILQHLLTCVEHLIILRERHCIASRPHSCGNDGDGIYRSHIREQMKENRMTRLMVSRNLLLFVRDQFALLLSADGHLRESPLDICLSQISAVLFRGHNRGLVQQVLQIRPGEPGRCLGNLL